MVKTLDRKQARKVYELERGKVSDSQWQRVVAVFDTDLPLTLDNVKLVASIKKELPKVNLRSLKVIADLKQTRKFITHQNYQLTGEDFLLLLKQFDIELHRNTYYKWFKRVGGFNLKRTYTLNQIWVILIQAHQHGLRTRLKEINVQGLVGS